MARESEVIERPLIPKTRSQMPRYLAIAAAVLVVVAAMVGMRSRRSPAVTSAPAGGGGRATTEAEPAIPVIAAVVQPASLTESLRVTGSLRTDQNVVLSSKLSGKVLMMAAKEGDTVRAGQLVAQIDDTEQRAQRTRAVAAVRAAEARLSQAAAGGRMKDVGAEGEYARARAATAVSRARVAQMEQQARIQDTAAETRVRSARSGLKSAQERLSMMKEGSRRQELQVAQQAVRRAEVDLATEQRNYQRREQLLKDGAISQEDVDEARRRLDFAQVQLANTREQLSMAQEGPRSQEVRMAEEQVTQAEQALQDAEANRAQRQISQEELNAAREALVQAQAAERSARAGLGQSQVTREDIRTAAAAVDQARADVAYYDEQIRQMRIISPVSGIVTQKYVNEGESVAPANAKLYTIVSRDSLFFEAVVSERQLPWLRPGQPVRVTVDARPGNVYSGTVREILPVAEGLSRSSRARIALRGARDLPVGAFARAVIPVSQKSGVLAVPAAAIQSEAGISFVFVIDGEGRARRHNIEMGIRDGDRVEVTSGVRSGDRIVSSGSPAITDGAKVTTQS